MSQDYAAVLKQAMNAHIGNKYGHAVPPPPFITPFGIKTFDALLGGGVPTSAPICITSTPETGKSTLSLQFAGTFLRTHPDGVVLYVNIEEAAGGDSNTTVANVTYMQNTDENHPVGYHDIEERIKTFGIDPARFLNKPVELNVKEVFELIMEMITIKRNIQQRTSKEVKFLIIWDSVAATPSSKDAEADNPNEIIG